MLQSAGVIAFTIYKLVRENVLLPGDFNLETKGPWMQSFLELYGLKNLIAKQTCYKNPEKALYHWSDLNK